MSMDRRLGACDDFLRCSAAASRCTITVPPFFTKFFYHSSNILSGFRGGGSFKKKAMREASPKWKNLQNQDRRIPSEGCELCIQAAEQPLGHPKLMPKTGLAFIRTVSLFPIYQQLTAGTAAFLQSVGNPIIHKLGTTALARTSIDGDSFHLEYEEPLPTAFQPRVEELNDRA
jgi:hypothetical protein